MSDQSKSDRASELRSGRCRTGCRTQSHESWGECLRASNIDINADIKGIPARRAWDKECHDYASLRRQGLQPQGTTRKHIERARKVADSK